jgi:hypothetical protein
MLSPCLIWSETGRRVVLDGGVNVGLLPAAMAAGVLRARVKRPPIREDLKVMLYQSQEADNTFITSDGASPYNSTR